ncbi:MAG: hypothetical protein ACXIT9_08530 [Nitritalea sp.]
MTAFLGSYGFALRSTLLFFMYLLISFGLSGRLAAQGTTDMALVTFDYSQTRPLYMPRVFENFTSMQSHEIRMKFHRKLFENFYAGFGASVRFYSEQEDRQEMLLSYQNTFLGLSPNLYYYFPLDASFDLFFGAVGTLEQGTGLVTQWRRNSEAPASLLQENSLREIFFTAHLEIGAAVHLTEHVSIIAAFNTFAISRNRSRFGDTAERQGVIQEAIVLDGWQMRDFSGQPDFRVGILLRFYRDY